jgi:glycosyltransferase involved in cell wall biosynthesis
MKDRFKDHPFFSIIIPTYNSGSFIRECLDSITNQDFKDFEVIIQDGCSSDGTLEIIKQVQAENPDVRINLISEKDDGVYEAMNKAIRRSKGDWLYFLGSDDRLYERSTLKKIYSRSPTADVVYGNVKMIHSGHVYNGSFILGKVLFEGNICHQAMFYQRTVFDQVGLYNTAYKVYADYDLNIRCFLNKGIRFQYVNQVIARYDENDGLTGRNTPDLAFHERREEYRRQYLQTFGGKLYPYIKVFQNNLEKLKHKLSRI